MLETPTNVIFVSSITIAEIMIKASIGKLQIDFNPLNWHNKVVLSLLNLAQDALFLKDMPFHHKDAFNNMLIGQSLSNSYPLMTDDSKIKLYNCLVI